MTEYLKKFLKGGPVYMTQEEGMNLSELGLIQPDVAQVSPINPNAVLVNLTESGKEKLSQMIDEEDRRSLPIPPTAPTAADRTFPQLPATSRADRADRADRRFPQLPAPTAQTEDSHSVVISSDVPIPKKGSVVKKARKKTYPFDQI